jgi:hypothetical protein
MKCLLAVFTFILTSAPLLHAFEIDLPPHYREDLERKRLKEASVLWRELDRNAVELAIREFVKKNPNFDGVAIDRVPQTFTWRIDGRVITCGDWHVFLADWELSYPALSRIDWKEARLVVAQSYNWKTKALQEDGDADIRLTFVVDRRGGPFRKKITASFDSADYGERVLILPIPGNVELRKANQVPEPMSGLAPGHGSS